MDSNVLDMLNKINEIENEFDDTIFIPCTEFDVDYFVDWIEKQRPGLELDLSDFLSFSKIVNGLNVNGLFVYSLSPSAENNIYDSNLDWWSSEQRSVYLFFADDDISWYCVDIKDGAFCILDKPSGDKTNEYGSFDELISIALGTAI